MPSAAAPPPALLKPPEAVAFDFNGTLSDDEPVLARVYERVFAERGIALPAAVYYELFAGLSDREIVAGVLAWAGRQPQPRLCAELLAHRSRLYLAEVALHNPVSATVADFVRRVAERVPVVIVSGAARAEIAAVLGGAGLAGIPAGVVSEEDVSRGKPDPEGYRIGLAVLNAGRTRPLAAGSVLAFEDSPAGVASALAAGMRCVAVLGTASGERLSAAARILPRLDWSIPLVKGWQ